MAKTTKNLIVPDLRSEEFTVSVFLETDSLTGDRKVYIQITDPEETSNCKYGCFPAGVCTLAPEMIEEADLAKILAFVDEAKAILRKPYVPTIGPGIY